jgi:hypothetical protein
MAEPDYTSLDPEERTNKFMALASLVIGTFSLCAALIPICGIAGSLVGLGLGVFGRRSEQRKLATVGMIVSALGLRVSIVYPILLLLRKQ